MQSDCAQVGRFLRWLWVADGFFLSVCFRVSSDRNGAFRRSRSDGRVAGSLPVLVGKSLAVVVVSSTLSESELETQALFSVATVDSRQLELPLASVTIHYARVSAHYARIMLDARTS